MGAYRIPPERPPRAIRRANLVHALTWPFRATRRLLRAVPGPVWILLAVCAVLGGTLHLMDSYFAEEEREAVETCERRCELLDGQVLPPARAYECQCLTSDGCVVDAIRVTRTCL